MTENIILSVSDSEQKLKNENGRAETNWLSGGVFTKTLKSFAKCA